MPALLAGLGMSAAALAAPGDFLFDPASFVDAEFRRSGALEAIGAQYAYARGLTGKGVLVAVLDSGLYARHPEFAGRVAGGWNFQPGQAAWDYADTERDEDTGLISGHGTHVAGIIAAARDGVQMHGVAYGARLLGVRIDTDVDWVGMDYAISRGAKVLNGSYGPDGTPPVSLPDGSPNPGYWDNVSAHPELLKYQLVPLGDLQTQVAALRRAAAADVLMVFAAGNDYREYKDQASHASGYGMYHLITPDFFIGKPGGIDPMFRFLDDEATTDLYDPAKYTIVDFSDPRVSSLDFSDLGGSMLTVVSVGPSGEIASYSNRCGQAAMWCLAAPGGDGDAAGAPIWSTHPDPANGYYVTMNGTSMAAPVVAGAAAVLRQAFPYMSARQIIEVILTTTNDGGLYGNHDIYGRGLLDLGRAVRGPGEFGADGFAPMFRADTRRHDSWFGNDIEGDGGLVKAGAGTLYLDGANTYTGDTVVEGGRLSVNGDTRQSAFTVQSGGTLGGIGTVGPTRVFGRVAPGNSIGTLTVAGDYVQAPGSVLEIEIDGAGLSDRLDVQGNADLQGGEVRILGLRGGSLGRSMSFMTVGGAVVGPGFAGVRDDYVFADLSLLQPAPGQFNVAVDRNATRFAALGRTANQRSAAGAIESMGAGAVPYEALIDLRDAGQAPGLYDQLSGELHATARTMMFEDVRLVRDEAMGRLSMGGGPSGRPADAPDARDGNGLWGRAMTAWSRHDGDGVSQDANRWATGLMIGRDVAWPTGARAGVAFGYTRSRVRAEGHNEATLDGYHVLAYGGVASGPWRLRGGVGQSWQVADTRREVDVAGLGRQTARYGGSTTQVFAEFGHASAFGAAEVEPYVQASQSWQHVGGFDEDGDAALSGRAGRASSTETSLGVRARWSLETGAGNLDLAAGAGWVHAWGSLSPQTQLAYAGGPDFEVSGTPAARDSLRLEARASLARTRTTRLEIGYAGRLGGGVRDHGLRIRLSHAF